MFCRKQSIYKICPKAYKKRSQKNIWLRFLVSHKNVQEQHHHKTYVNHHKQKVRQINHSFIVREKHGRFLI